jgi:hypothetical protein
VKVALMKRKRFAAPLHNIELTAARPYHKKVKCYQSVKRFVVHATSKTHYVLFISIMYFANSGSLRNQTLMIAMLINLNKVQYTE